MSQEYTRQVYSAKCMFASTMYTHYNIPSHNTPFELSERWEGDNQLYTAWFNMRLTNYIFAVLKSSNISGHVPQEISSVCWYFPTLL